MLHNCLHAQPFAPSLLLILRYCLQVEGRESVHHNDSSEFKGPLFELSAYRSRLHAKENRETGSKIRNKAQHDFGIITKKHTTATEFWAVYDLTASNWQPY
jgi:hypothetical protein